MSPPSSMGVSAPRESWSPQVSCLVQTTTDASCSVGLPSFLTDSLFLNVPATHRHHAKTMETVMPASWIKITWRRWAEAVQGGTHEGQERETPPHGTLASLVINLSRRYSDTGVLAKTGVKPRDLGILTQASYANEEARDDDFLTIKTDENLRDEEARVQHMPRDLMDTREGTLWLQMTRKARKRTPRFKRRTHIAFSASLASLVR